MRIAQGEDTLIHREREREREREHMVPVKLFHIYKQLSACTSLLCDVKLTGFYPILIGQKGDNDGTKNRIKGPFFFGCV